MLSLGKHYLDVPTDPKRNAKWRRWVGNKAAKDEEFQAEQIRKCSEDLFYYANTFVWQHNPKHLGSEVGPFIFWDFQIEDTRRTIQALFVDQTDILNEKSRELGATWKALILFDWCCLFHTWKKFLGISHTADAVDRTADSDSLFWKVQFMHDHLPKWITRGVRKRKFGFEYPGTHSIFSGAASTVRSGVGGRATAILLDEFGRQRDDAAIWSDTADTGPRLIISTHYGLGTKFYELSQSEGIRKTVMHWSQHPEKNRGLYQYDQETSQVEVIDRGFKYGDDFRHVTDGSPTGGPYPGLRSPWYDAECSRRASSRDVAMHLDIDPKGSVSQFFDPREIAILIKSHAQEPWWEGGLEYDRDLGRPIALKEARGGLLKLWCHLPNGRPIEGFYAAGADISWGTGASPSVISFADASTGVKVAECANPHIRPREFAELCVALCWLFRSKEGGGAKFCWEMQGPGRAFGDRVIELGYRNVYYRTNEHRLEKMVSDMPGWYSAEKKEVLEELRYDLHTLAYLNRSERALKECLAFKYDKRGGIVHGEEEVTDDPSGARINHADRVIADALCNKMRRSLGLGTASPVKKENILPLSLEWRRQHHDNMRRMESAW